MSAGPGTAVSGGVRRSRSRSRCRSRSASRSDAPTLVLETSDEDPDLDVPHQVVPFVGVPVQAPVAGVLAVRGMSSGSQNPCWDVPPARWDAPGRRMYTRGSLSKVHALETAGVDLRSAAALFEADKYAASTKPGLASRLKWWHDRAAAMGWEPFPLSSAKIAHAGTLLKAAGYRSAKGYFGVLRKEHTRLYSWDEGLTLEVREAVASCDRGKGPGKQSGYFELEELEALECSVRSPEVSDGYAFPRLSTLVAIHWAQREIQSSLCRLGAVTFGPGPGCGTATLDLPVSKSDPTALGSPRTHGCCCPLVGCPVLAVRQLYDLAAGMRRPMTPDELELRPLSPTLAGGFPTKRAVVACYAGLARLLGKEVHVTGHMPRVAGAVRMAKSGFEIWKIQIFCRWGSAVALKYIREAPLEQSSSWATQVAGGLQLKDLRDRVRKELCCGPGALDQQAALETVRPALEDVEKLIKDKVKTAEEQWQLVAGAISSRIKALEDIPVRTLPLHVGSAAPHAVVLHRPRNHLVSYCGWAWGGNRWAILRDRANEKDELCRRCEKAFYAK